MTRRPFEAFSRFLELTVDMKEVFPHDAEDYLELLDAFLANAAKHREHVRLKLGLRSPPTGTRRGKVG